MELVTIISVQPKDSQSLLAMMRRFNAACNWLSEIAFQERLFHWLPLQRRAYYELRARYEVSGSEATTIVRKVAYVYKDKARRSRQATFQSLGAIPLHRHRYRSGIIRFYGQEAAYTPRPGIILPAKVPQATLSYRDKRFFIQQVLLFPEPVPYEAHGFLGCDLGIVNILVDSEGEVYSGGHLNGLRHRHSRLRARLQAKGTRSAKRLLRKRRYKEDRFARWVNHNISKQVVAKAKTRTWGIALEDLKGIRERVQVRKAQRRQHHAWGFKQLRRFIEYKAALAGVPLVLVDPRYTSQTCPACGTIDRANRMSQAIFRCVQCGFAGHADVIAAVNVGRRAVSDQPNTAASASCESLHSRLSTVKG